VEVSFPESVCNGRNQLLPIVNKELRRLLNGLKIATSGFGGLGNN
jgi:hypothetical protein